jgi:hypothetical protein
VANSHRRRHRERLPAELSGFARFIGLMGAVAVLAVTFPQLAMTQIARDSAGGKVAFVQTMLAASLVVTLILTIIQIVTRTNVARATTTAVAFGATAAAEIVLAVLPCRVTLGASLVLGAWLMRCVGPLRGVGSQRWKDHSSSSQARAQAWLFATLTSCQLVFWGLTWAIGWRGAVAVQAVALAAEGILVARRYDGFVPKTVAAREDRGSEWWEVFAIPVTWVAIMTMGSGVFMFSLLFTTLQPHLVAIGLRESVAGLVVAALGVARIVSIPFMDRYGRLANTRMPLASQLSSRWVLASAALATVTMLPIGIWALVPIVLAACLLEIGQNCQNLAVRGYVSALSLDASQMVSVSTATFAYVGGQLAVLLTWRKAVASWAIAALVAWVLTWAMRRYPQRVTRHRSYAAGSDTIIVTLESTEGFTLRITAPGGEEFFCAPVREGASLTIEAAYSNNPAAPRVRKAVLQVRYGVRARTVRPRAGRLRWGSRCPLVGTDGRVYGRVSWRGSRGRFVVHPDHVELTSTTLARRSTLALRALHR